MKVNAGEGQEDLTEIARSASRGLSGGGSFCGEQASCGGELGGDIACGKQAVMADLDEAFGQDVARSVVP